MDKHHVLIFTDPHPDNETKRGMLTLDLEGPIEVRTGDTTEGLTHLWVGPRLVASRSWNTDSYWQVSGSVCPFPLRFLNVEVRPLKALQNGGAQ